MSSEEVYDLCVIGAGMFGSAAARHASANVSLKVCLIGPNEPTLEERPTREIFSSHYDEGRITRILDDTPACQVLSKHSIERYKEIEKLSGISFHEPVGCLFIGSQNEEFMRTLTESASIGNVALSELSKHSTFQKRFPFIKLQKDEYALLDDGGAGYISPRSMVAAQKKIAELQGCRIIDSVVSTTKTLTNGLHEVITETKGIVKAKRLLIATGSFVNTKDFDVLKPLLLNRYEVTATKLKISEEEAKRLSSLPTIIIDRMHSEALASHFGAYILPPIKYPDGHFYLKIGISVPDLKELKTLEEMKNWCLSDGDKAVMDKCSKFLKELLPELKVEGMSGVICISCMTPSELPYIDRVSPTVTVAVAGNGKGAKFSDEVGRIAAQLSVTGQWDSELCQDLFSAKFK